MNEDDVPNIEKLDCSNTKITEIPHIDGLKYLNCECTSITNIPYIETLTHLSCYRTKIKSLPYLKHLEYLDCSNTYITTLPKISGLRLLRCYNLLITEIPFVKSTMYNMDRVHAAGPFGSGPSYKLTKDNSDIDINCVIYAKNCRWLYPSQELIAEVIKLQKWFRKYPLSIKLTNIIPEITKIYYTPKMKGYMLNKIRFDKN